MVTINSQVQAPADEFIFGDPRPDAPLLAQRGAYAVGVRTLTWVNPAQLDIMNVTDDHLDVRYDRPLTVEVWYPAILAAGQVALTEYTEFAGRADNPDMLAGTFTFKGRAARDATPETSGAAYPLLIISHGFPGSGLQLSYLGENLASKGYVVIAIHHTDSNFDDVTPTSTRSALLNRALDIQFVLHQAAVDDFTRLLADTSNVGLIGYSFGGYGVLNYLGAGLNDLTVNVGAPGGVLAVRGAGHEVFAANVADERIKAAILFAPYGGDLTLAGFPGLSFWDEAAFAHIRVPTFWVAGTQDDVSIYAGVVKIFGWTVHSERYLLTYENARHNVAPNPPNPLAADLPNFERYADPVWDARKINNINQHFVTAFMGLHLQGQAAYQSYLAVPVVNANDGVYDMSADGTPGDRHTYWLGFPPRSAVGLRLEYVVTQTLN